MAIEPGRFAAGQKLFVPKPSDRAGALLEAGRPRHYACHVDYVDALLYINTLARSEPDRQLCGLMRIIAFIDWAVVIEKS